MIKRKYDGEYTTAWGCFDDGSMRHYTMIEDQEVDQWVPSLNGWQFIQAGLDPVPHWYQFWTWLTIVPSVSIEGVREVSHITLNCVELEDLEGIAWMIVLVPEDNEPFPPYVPIHREFVPSQYEIMPSAGKTHIIDQGMFDLEGAHPFEIDASVQLTKNDSIVLIFTSPVRAIFYEVEEKGGTSRYTQFRILPFQFHVTYYVKYL